MTKNDIDSLMLHLWSLYPKAAERWPKARQQAFKDQLGSMRLDFEQARAVVNDVAMNTKGSWAPPEGEILKRMRGAVQDRAVEQRISDHSARYEPKPGDRTVQEWTQHFIDHPEETREWSADTRKGFDMLCRSRTRRLEDLGIVRRVEKARSR